MVIFMNRNEFKKYIQNSNIEKMPIRKAVRLKCLDCCCNQIKEVELCPVTDCSLWPFRFGYNPWSNKTMSEEQKEKIRKRFSKNNEGDYEDESEDEEV